ncbi:YhjD/YihY/BrkB family envelope integrity protein [Nocardioides bizhenqiangii]|uniref:YhjD/YihY/BrkB family envelope integrity protein n=1 Tax=Nocardioides bizhenqiangii TaxID=3095076 RepID=A0ABZ0ZVX2_9ACTN|nr:YhjD/YihY/BrkB family envelope integrity protein [Nocardioides sp. HM61]WQQ28260.1 YhjD/YihY/BrkB family envelope integrity protein [Nocardioides sp. HM61]
MFWRRLVSWLLVHWPGRVVVRTVRSFNRVELFDRSMTIAAQLFTCIFPILILLATWATRKDADRIGDSVSMPEESRVLLEEAVTAAGDAAFGIVGTVVVVVTATGVSRALTRAFAAIWDLPRPRSSLGHVWRWIAVVLALAFSLLVVRIVGQLVSGVPPETVWPAAVSLVCDLAIAMFVPWILLSGAVRPRLLLPGALIMALVMLAGRPVIAAWLPGALETSADRYGSIGVAFTYLALLYSVSFAFMATAILGQVIATDEGGLGRWIRADAAGAVMQPDGANEDEKASHGSGDDPQPGS